MKIMKISQLHIILHNTVNCYCIDSDHLLERAYHSDVIIEGSLFMWGGKKKGLSLTHDSPEKKLFTSVLGVFSLAACKWDKKSTIGTSPGGTIEYSCCNIREKIFYFGGSVKVMTVSIITCLY